MPHIPKQKKRPWQSQHKANTVEWGRKGHDPFYDSTAWRKARKVCLDAQPICKYCKSSNNISAASVCDHIIPIHLGGDRLSTTNHQGMCASCHNTKSSIEGKYTDVIQLKAYYESNKGGVGVKNYWAFS